MLQGIRMIGVTLLVAISVLSAGAQTDPKLNMAEKTAVAVTVNGHPIYETAVERALQGVAAEERGKMRTEVINFIVENTIIDQYLSALKLTVDPADVAKQFASFKEEVKKSSQDYETLLLKMKLTEAELKDQIHNQLRWEKFVNQQATDEKLKALFDHMPEAFDGTTVRARHILLTPAADEKSKQDALAKIKQVRAEIAQTATDAIAKLPPTADNVTKAKAIEDTFSEAAKKYSACPSKVDGGDLRYFPRYGSMVEPFARAAFALKSHQISDAVQTQFGYHIILVTHRKEGTPTKFDDAKVKDAVKEVYESRMREAVLDQMKPRAKVEIAAVKN